MDHCQAVSPLSQAQIHAIIAGFTAAGIQARASSIHINAWQGDFDKARMAVRVLTETFGLDRMQLEQEVMYVGDAPNDAPMFATFRHTVGVANILKHRAALGWEPAWLDPPRSWRRGRGNRRCPARVTCGHRQRTLRLPSGCTCRTEPARPSPSS